MKTWVACVAMVLSLVLYVTSLEEPCLMDCQVKCEELKTDCEMIANAIPVHCTNPRDACVQDCMSTCGCEGPCKQTCQNEFESCNDQFHACDPQLDLCLEACEIHCHPDK